MSQLPSIEDKTGIGVYSLDSGRRLLDAVCNSLELTPGRIEERTFEDGEHKIRPLESVRGRDVFVVQSLHGDESLSVNDRLIRTLFLIAALGDAGAESVTAIAPYLCYARKDMRTRARDPVSTRYVAQLLESVGVDRVVTVDVHNRAAFQNAFRVNTEHLTAAPLFVDRIRDVVGSRKAAVVSPDAGGVKRAERFRQRLERRLERSVSSAYVEKFRSQGEVRGGRVVGDVDGRAVVIVDDLVSSGTTLARAADGCRQSGASEIIAVATHGVFSPGFAEVIADSEIDRFVVADTVDIKDAAVGLQGLDVVDVAPLVADAIARLHTNQSLGHLEGR